jgi:hypothetical protein
MAKIHAENSIRQKNQAVNFLRLSSRMDTVAQRVQASRNMQKLGESMGSVVKSMGVAMESMNVEQLTNTMDQFEKTFESLDIQSNVMEKSIQASTSMTTPEDEVTALMQEVFGLRNACVFLLRVKFALPPSARPFFLFECGILVLTSLLCVSPQCVRWCMNIRSK